MAWKAAEIAYNKHLENFKKTEDLNKVTAYYDAQKAWMHQSLNPEPVKADQDAAMVP